MTRLTRRRALFIGAAAAVSLAAGRATKAAAAEWRGIALGADARIRLAQVDAADAAPVFAGVEAELSRLEGLFSLYRPDSVLSRLNRSGTVDAPPAEFLELLSVARAAHEATQGLFDPTVQPVFRAYAEAASAGRALDPEALADALSRVGFDAVHADGDRVRFLRPGMSMTLNGVAQGYITDRVTALLRGMGFRDMLVNMGEIAAAGRPDGQRGWRVAIAGNGPVLTLSDRAIATSAPLGTVLDPAARVGHIFDPRRGWTKPVQRQVSVVASSAALADALSTAGALMGKRALMSLAGDGRMIFPA